jgi:hypothetical protein
VEQTPKNQDEIIGRASAQALPELLTARLTATSTWGFVMHGRDMSFVIEWLRDASAAAGRVLLSIFPLQAADRPR